MSQAILIHGPTASGKTHLAVQLAKRLNGELINADAIQVYADLQVLTARPTKEELDGVPAHLFGHVDGATRYNTGQWLLDAKTTFVDVQSRGKLAIFVGGTGLYHLCLVDGLSDIPLIPDDIEREVRSALRAEGASALYKRLCQFDPVAAKNINAQDSQRISRAYGVWLTTGKPISDFLGVKRPPLLGKQDWLGIALTPPRAKLYSIIDRRFEAMLVEGAMEEVRTLLARTLDDNLPIMKAHGVPWMKAFLNGDISAQIAADNSRRDTRRYAKRQFTWISRQFPLWPRIPSQKIETQINVVTNLWREVDTRMRAG